MSNILMLHFKISILSNTVVISGKMLVKLTRNASASLIYTLLFLPQEHITSPNLDLPVNESNYPEHRHIHQQLNTRSFGRYQPTLGG